MIIALFRDYPWLVFSFLLLGCLLSVVMLGIARRGALSRFASVLFGVALAVELSATLSPIHVGASSSGVCAVNRDFVTPLFSPQGLMNVALYVPVALLSVLVFRRPAVSLAGGVLLSAWTEFAQAVTPRIGRSCTSEDFLANGLGALIGVALAVLLCRFRIGGGQTAWRSAAGRRDFVRASGLFAIGGVVLVVIGAVFVTPVLVEVAELTKADSAQKDEAKRMVREVYGDGQVISGIQYAKGSGGQKGQLLVTLKNGFLNFTEDESFVTGSTSSPSLAGVSGKSVRTDEEAIGQAAGFVRSRFPWALEKSEVSVHPTVAGTGQRTVAWRQRKEGVLMPMRMDVVVEPDGRISAFTGRNESHPDTPPGHRIGAERARAIASEYLGGSGTFIGSDLMMQKSGAGQWESRWAVSFEIPPAAETGPDDVPTGSDFTTVTLQADTGKIIEVNS